MNTTPIAGRMLGCLYGVALGDAMGMPGELWSRSRIRAHFGRIDRFLPGPDGHVVVDGFRAGQVTDDTQQMIMLAESIIRAGGRVDPDVLAADFLSWADRVGATEHNVLGPTSARAVERLRAGRPATDTGVAGTTNGAAMRIAPVGLLCPSADLTALVDEVEASCVIAHHTNVAVAGAAMIAAAVSAAVDAPAGQAHGSTVDDALRAAHAAAGIGIDRGRDEPGASLVRRAAMGVEQARTTADDDEFLQFVYDLVGTGTETTESVPAALALVVRAVGDPLRCALLAANLGGDTDTIGAMAVGICGAIGGIEAIPRPLIDRLNEVNDLPLEPLAEQLLAWRTQRARKRG